MLELEYGPPENGNHYRCYVYTSRRPFFGKRKQKFKWVLIAPNGEPVAGNLEHLQSQDHAYQEAVKYFWWSTIVVGGKPWD